MQPRHYASADLEPPAEGEAEEEGENDREKGLKKTQCPHNQAVTFER